MLQKQPPAKRALCGASAGAESGTAPAPKAAPSARRRIAAKRRGYLVEAETFMMK
jgi:hypothetical protein